VLAEGLEGNRGRQQTNKQYEAHNERKKRKKRNGNLQTRFLLEKSYDIKGKYRRTEIHDEKWPRPAIFLATTIWIIAFQLRQTISIFIHNNGWKMERV